ncbi:hypothetical protein Cgig2_022468 [Carnegiea gigantea]|uniref:DUF4283 domain-containing protein n=1 Tax=Carnegiea gigantea TaxID=171969 RepID=A0A9Q1K8J3_9CARY|nr:hypothetical protein Cgig2_022468 [Carnegiea gigantea]
MKRVGECGDLEQSDFSDEEMEEANPLSPRTTEVEVGEMSQTRLVQGVSYRDSLQRNNPNLVFETRDNPIWSADYLWENPKDDDPPEYDDPTCPTILLMAQDKRVLRETWRNALIIKMFDKGIGFLQLKRKLKAKWALKGDFSLIDISHDYYVTRFSNMDDYEHVMMNGPSMLGDNYVVIQEWIPNFVPEEETITQLIAWPQTLNRVAGLQTPLASEERMTIHMVVGCLKRILNGSRFRALANIDLSMEMEMNELEIQGNTQEERELLHVEVRTNEEINVDVNEDITRQENITNARPHENGLHGNDRPIVQHGHDRSKARGREFMNVLKEHLRMQRPHILALLETHVIGPRADVVREQIGFQGRFRMEARGFQGEFGSYGTL